MSDGLYLNEVASAGPVIPVVIIERVADAVPLGEALLAGGVSVIEITLRTPAALAAIEAIARELPELHVGAGTLRTAVDVQAARDAGARFAVSPGFRPAISRSCKAMNLPLLPGVATSSEVMAASEEGHQIMKFFPAQAAGGLGLLQAWASPFADLRFCPTGGLTLDLARQYLALPNVAVCGGSWLTPLDALRAQDWSRVTALARETVQALGADQGHSSNR